MEKQDWIITHFVEKTSDVALRDFHTMPDLKPRKTMSQKNEERQQLRDDELAYVTAGGCIDYRDITGEPIKPEQEAEKRNDKH